LLISKRSGLVLIVTFWRTKYNKKWSISTLRETYINWNWLDQAWGRFCRDALYEMNVFVRDVKYRRFSLKMLLKLASRCWFDDLNEICWRASFVCWPKMVLVLHLLRSFLKIFVWTSPGAFDVFESWCVEFVDIPGCVWNFMSGFFFFELINPFKIDVEKMNCAGSSYCQIIGWNLTMKRKKIFWDLQKFWSFSEWLKLFSLIFGFVVVVFVEDDDDELGNFRQNGKHVLDTDSWSHSDATMKDLWRRFFWSFNGWSRSWFKIMLWWSWGPFIHFVKRSSWFFCVMKLKFCKCWICLRRKVV
jgi:hypothetical protein